MAYLHFRFPRCLVIRAARIHCDDVRNTDPRTSDEGAYRGGSQKDVLDENPVEATGMRPEEDGLDNDGEQKTWIVKGMESFWKMYLKKWEIELTQNGEENSTDQTDKRFEIWNSHRNTTHNYDNSRANGNLCEVVSLHGNFIFNFTPQNVHRNEELKSESEENRKGNQILNDFGEAAIYKMAKLVYWTLKYYYCMLLTHLPSANSA